MLITLVAAARPNFIKIAPIIKALEQKKQAGYDIDYRLVHTGQHWDHNMSQIFFQELDIPRPHINLEAGGGSQAEQTAQVMIRFEQDLLAHPPNAVIVVGDVNSTMACTLAARKLCIPVMHVEAGIRSGDLTMPEEINRIVTDSISNVFYTTTPEAGENLLQSGIEPERIVWVGNTMIDTLLAHKHRFYKPDIWDESGLDHTPYIVLTLHRPSNVDQLARLQEVMGILEQHASDYIIVFPVHPRTKTHLASLHKLPAQLICTEPLSYLEFNYLVSHAAAVITDSGGITEETTCMGIPCMTLRDSTERPETCTIGTNELLGTDSQKLIKALETLRQGHWKKGAIPARWDGKAAERIVEDIIQRYGVGMI
jgi:UDP-N-acetylglucosamine 2-epimerase (non-hydrolysing)